jgi:hypothetical protein
MRKLIFKVFSIFMLLGLVACEKELPTFLEFESVQFSSIDATGGDWTPILLNSGADLSIPAPSEVNSSAYLAELSALETAIAQKSKADQQAIDYWMDSPVVRCQIQYYPWPKCRWNLYIAEPN